MIFMTLLSRSDLPEAILEPITVENVDHLTQLHVAGRGEFSDVDISPDGNQMAVITTAGVWFYDWNNLANEPVYLQHEIGFGSDVRFSRSGQYMEVFSYYPDVGNSIRQVYRIQPSISSIAGILSPDGRYIIQNDRAIDIASGTSFQFEQPQSETISRNIQDIVGHPDGSMLLVPKTLRNYLFTIEVELFDTTANQFVGTLQFEDDERLSQYTRFAFSDDGVYLLASIMHSRPSIVSEIYRWTVDELVSKKRLNLSDGELLWSGNDERLLDFQPFQDLLLVKSSPHETYQPTTRLINLRNGTVLDSIDTIHSFLHPLSGHLISMQSGTGSEWTVFDHTSRQIVGILEDFGGAVDTIVLNHDETKMLSINQYVHTNSISVFVNLRNTQTWHLQQQFRLDDQIDTQIGFQADGRPIVVSTSGWSTNEKRLGIIDVQTGAVMYSRLLGVNPFTSLSNDARFLFISTESERSLLDLQRPSSPASLNLPEAELAYTHAFFSPDSHYLILAESDEKNHLLRIWDLHEQVEVARLVGQDLKTNPFVQPIIWTDDGKKMVICAGQLSVWSLESLFAHSVIEPEMVIPDAVSCHMDSSQFNDLIIIPTNGAGIQTWLPGQSEPTARYGVENWWIIAQFSPDGSIIFGIDYFGEMQAWATNTGMHLATYHPSPWQVNNIHFMRDRELMLFPAEDGTIRIWGIDSINDS